MRANAIGDWGRFPPSAPGPHDLALVDSRRGGGILIANGGTRTHPETGREVLNPDAMEPSLAVIDPRTGRCLRQVDLGPSLRGLSIRHLAVAPDGTAAFGCQCVGGDGTDLTLLVGVLRPDGNAELLAMPEDDLAALDNYVGSVSLDASGRVLAATGRAAAPSLSGISSSGAIWVGGVSATCAGSAAASASNLFVVSSGNAGMRLTGAAPEDLAPFGDAALQRRMWDNHLLRIERA